MARSLPWTPPPVEVQELAPSRAYPVGAVWSAYATFLLVVGVPALIAALFKSNIQGALPILGGFGALLAVGVHARLRSEQSPDPAPSTTAGTLSALLLTFFGIAWPLIANPVLPQSLLAAPFLPFFLGGLYGLAPFGLGLCVLGALSSYWPAAWARRPLWMASIVVTVVHGAWIAGLGVTAAFLLSFPAFERARRDPSPRDDVWIGAWHFDRVGTFPEPLGDRDYFVLELCPGTPRLQSCFSGHGGSGFLYLGPDHRWPIQGFHASGRLPGGWAWYTTDDR